MHWCLENNWIAFYECTLYTPRYLPKWNKNLYSCESLYVNVCNVFMYNLQRLETTQMFSNWWRDKHTVIHSYHEILLSNKKEQTADLLNNVNESQMHFAKWKEPDSKRRHSVWFHLHLWHTGIRTENWAAVTRGWGWREGFTTNGCQGISGRGRVIEMWWYLHNCVFLSFLKNLLFYLFICLFI